MERRSTIDRVWHRSHLDTHVGLEYQSDARHCGLGIADCGFSDDCTIWPIADSLETGNCRFAAIAGLPWLNHPKIRSPRLQQSSINPQSSILNPQCRKGESDDG